MTTNATSTSVLDDADEEYDVVVIGSGIGGLSCGSLLAKYGYKVKIFESHYLAGGCCHMFDHRAPDGSLYKFEVGPSIWEVWIVRRVIRCEWCSTHWARRCQ